VTVIPTTRTRRTHYRSRILDRVQQNFSDTSVFLPLFAASSRNPCALLLSVVRSEDIWEAPSLSVRPVREASSVLMGACCPLTANVRTLASLFFLRRSSSSSSRVLSNTLHTSSHPFACIYLENNGSSFRSCTCIRLGIRRIEQQLKLAFLLSPILHPLISCRHFALCYGPLTYMACAFCLVVSIIRANPLHFRLKTPPSSLL
jgi:hypothetical protein